ncbi:hypothetical protein ABXS75_11880 [Roseburia hominis]
MNEDLFVEPDSVAGDAHDEASPGLEGTPSESEAPVEEALMPDSSNEEYLAQYSETLEAISVSVEGIGQRLDTITNCLIVTMVGIALLVGVFASNILAKYFRA